MGKLSYQGYGPGHLQRCDEKWEAMQRHGTLRIWKSNMDIFFLNDGL